MPQFRILCFGLLTTHQVFTTVMAHVNDSAFNGHPDTLVSGRLADSCSVNTSGSLCKGFGFGSVSRA